MAKRFTDSEKWIKNKWYRTLTPEHKLFWNYICDMCDTVGVWEEDIELASILIGYTYSMDSLLELFKNKIHIFRNGKKWWIKDFIDFQYGKLVDDSKNRPHQSYIKLLKKHSLWIEYTKSIHTLKEQDKDKDMDKDKDQDKEVNIQFSKFWDLYDYKKNKDECEKLWIGEKKRRDGKKINDEERSLIMSHLPKYVESTFKNGEYPGRSHPHTYLYNKGWEDEIPVPKKPHSNRKKESIKFIFICQTHPKNSVQGETKNDYHTCRVLVENVAGIKKECGEKMVLEDVVSLKQVFSQMGVE